MNIASIADAVSGGDWEIKIVRHYVSHLPRMRHAGLPSSRHGPGSSGHLIQHNAGRGGPDEPGHDVKMEAPVIAKAAV